jgi:hypothetical protein
MDYFWKEHKRFLIAVGGGLVGFLLVNGFVLAPLREKAHLASRKLSTERVELEARMREGVPSPETLRVAQIEREQARKLVSSLAADVSFKAPERFRKPKEGARSTYDDLKIKVNDELQARAVKQRITYTKFSMGDDASDDRLDEYFLRLAAAERLASLAIESEVERIEALDPMSGGARGGEEPGAAKASFLTKHALTMKFSGSASSVFKVLHGVQKKGAFLAVTQFETRRPDASKDLFDASIAVALLRVEEKAPLEARQ